jgi:hypothetical protein
MLARLVESLLHIGRISRGQVELGGARRIDGPADRGSPVVIWWRQRLGAGDEAGSLVGNLLMGNRSGPAQRHARQQRDHGRNDCDLNDQAGDETGGTFSGHVEFSIPDRGAKAGATLPDKCESMQGCRCNQSAKRGDFSVDSCKSR